MSYIRNNCISVLGIFHFFLSNSIRSLSMKFCPPLLLPSTDHPWFTFPPLSLSLLIGLTPETSFHHLRLCLRCRQVEERKVVFFLFFAALTRLLVYHNFELPYFDCENAKLSEKYSNMIPFLFFSRRDGSDSERRSRLRQKSALGLEEEEEEEGKGVRTQIGRWKAICSILGRNYPRVCRKRSRQKGHRGGAGGGIKRGHSLCRSLNFSWMIDTLRSTSFPWFHVKL